MGEVLIDSSFFVQTICPSDKDLRERLAQKLTQVDAKEKQVDEILAQLEALLQRRRAAEARGNFQS